MSDLLSTLVFLACLVVTVGLVKACEWLRPADGAAPGSSAATEHRS